MRFEKKDGKVVFTTLKIYEDIGATDMIPYMKKR